MFDGSRLSSSPAFFDVKKMGWLSGEYFKKMGDDEYLKFVKPFINFDTKQFGKKLDVVLLIFKNQINYATQLNELVPDLFLKYDLKLLPKEIKDFIKTPIFKQNLTALKTVLSQFKELTLENGNEFVNKVKELSGLSGKELYMPIRLVAVAKEHGPEMNKILYVVGIEKMLKNINLFKV
jgi:glutamyl/glutaminyl-tRNA synthetase